VYRPTAFWLIATGRGILSVVVLHGALVVP